MKENNVVELSGRVEAADALTAMLRAGAQELIRQAVDAELQALLASHAARVTDGGRSKAKNFEFPTHVGSEYVYIRLHFQVSLMLELT